MTGMRGETDGIVVLVVDDHPVFRAGLVALLGGDSRFRTILQADTVMAGLDVARREAPSIALVDLGLPDGSGIELTRQLTRLQPACRVLVLTMTSAADVARSALEAGASGYLVKETDPSAVLAAVLTVAGGGIVLGPHLDSNAVLTQDRHRPPAPFQRLSPREIQIVRMVAEGLGNAAIAARLGLAEKTVRNQVSVILDKAGASDRFHLALLARDADLIG